MKLIWNVSLVGLLLAGCVRNIKESNAKVGASFTGEVTTCFSPSEACDERLIEFIESAKKSLELAIFDITHTEITNAIIRASKRVSVRLVVDKRQSREPRSLVDLLRKAGVPLRFGRQKGIMHHKFCIVDGKKVETGSFNYTFSASFKNQENQVYLSDAESVERYHSLFEKVWKSSREE
jgi:phosphatidylserine/phosphatidylglycerophosphate/cardiolipin synthase-like enzyme